MAPAGVTPPDVPCNRVITGGSASYIIALPSERPFNLVRPEPCPVDEPDAERGTLMRQRSFLIGAVTVAILGMLGLEPSFRGGTFLQAPLEAQAAQAPTF